MVTRRAAAKALSHQVRALIGQDISFDSGVNDQTLAANIVPNRDVA